jgi:hypothetical protein
MGDRAICEVKLKKGSLFVYTHWGGFDLPKDAKEAVKKAQPRWDDEPYATHIIVDQLTKEGRDQETGFGIMLDDGAEDEYNHDKPSVIIDLTKQTLQVIREEEHGTYPFKEL